MGEYPLRISRRTFLGGAAAFGIVSIFSPTLAFATPTAAEKQAEADGIRAKVVVLKEELLEKSNIYGAALDDHDAAIAAMDEAQLQIDEKSSEVEALQEKLGMRVKSMYRSGSVSFMDILFGSSSFEEFATNWDLLDKLNTNDAEMVEEAKLLREELQAAYDEYEKQEQIAAEKTEEARIAKEEIEVSAGYYEELLNQLDEEARQLLAAEEEAAAIAAAAAAAAAAEREAANAGGSNSGSSGTSVSSDPGDYSDAGDGPGSDSGSSGGSGGGSATDYGPPSADVLSEAQKYLGMPYVWGGTSPSDGGFDCSGLVYYCHLRCGRSVPPRTTGGYGGGGFPVSEAQPGDVLWNPTHVGICASAGGGSYIHASNSGGSVCWGSYPIFERAYRF